MSPARTKVLPLYSSLCEEAVFCEMVELFVDEMPGRVARLRGLYEARDWEGLRRTAHQLQGLSVSYGFDSLAPYAARLEAALARRSPSAEIAALVEDLAEQCNRASAAVPAGNASA